MCQSKAIGGKHKLFQLFHIFYNESQKNQKSKTKLQIPLLLFYVNGKYSANDLKILTQWLTLCTNWQFVYSPSATCSPKPFCKIRMPNYTWLTTELYTGTLPSNQKAGHAFVAVVNCPVQQCLLTSFGPGPPAIDIAAMKNLENVTKNRINNKTNNSLHTNVYHK